MKTTWRLALALLTAIGLASVIPLRAQVFPDGGIGGGSGGTSLPVADTQTIVKGSADATKLIRFEVDGLTTGTTRVITAKNSDGTMVLDNVAASSLITSSGVGGSNGGFWAGAVGNTAGQFFLNTTQTPDSAYLGVGSDSNALILAETGDRAFDFAHAVRTNPTLYIHSAGQTTTDFASYTHLGQAPNRVTVTVNGATTFAITTGYVVLECTGAETINTITGGLSGMVLYIENSDTECTIADDDSATAADAIDLTGVATSDVGAVAKVITLLYNGSHWLQVSESDN